MRERIGRLYLLYSWSTMSINGIRNNSVKPEVFPLRNENSAGNTAGDISFSSPALDNDIFVSTAGKKTESISESVKITSDSSKTNETKPDEAKQKKTQEITSSPSVIVTLDESTVSDSNSNASIFSKIGGAVTSFAGYISHLIKGDVNISEYREQTEQISNLEKEYCSLSDAELKGKTIEFKNRIEKMRSSGEPVDKALKVILPEAFAAMREADKRVLGMRPFDEQVIAGIAAHDGHIVEQKTGEGKTLMETLPVYLNALAGRGVHVVTANEYLAKRDAEWMGKALNYMGISVGIISQEMTDEERKKANQADVTYGTNDEFGFQYLRDNLTHDKQSRTGRDLSGVFALVDEVDSILIDEARTPLIISRRSKEEPPPYGLFSELAHYLREGEDYKVDRKDHLTLMTEKGLIQAEKMLDVDNLYADENAHMVPYVRNSITAKALYTRDVDYVIRDGQIVIVDEFTGRLMPGRRYSEGLHEAIEAKEGVEVKQGTETLAMITFQNYFRLYGKLAGMTGTANTAEKEFREVFGKDVAVIPTHKPVIRNDLPDIVYKTEKEKFVQVALRIKDLISKGQPVLVGTRSIEKSEYLSGILNQMGISHNVLNAKNHFKEAEIIAQAGRSSSVTVATNMAGRGVDIKLGGDPDKLAEKLCNEMNISFEEALNRCKSDCQADKEKVKNAGGLAVIGTERHEDRRIDDQLRGRSGRQGDPGSSQFFISLDDDLIRMFGGDKLKRLANKLGVRENEAIQNSFVSKAIEVAQEKCETRNLDMRKYLMRYDGIINKQREIVYNDRDAVLNGAPLEPAIESMLDQALNVIVEKNMTETGRLNEDIINTVDKDLSSLFSLQEGWLRGKKFKSKDELSEYIRKCAQDAYKGLKQSIDPENLKIIEREIFLTSLDENWIYEQTDLKDLREGIWMRAYAQKDPDMEYVGEAHKLFESMKDNVATDTVKMLFGFRHSALYKT